MAGDAKKLQPIIVKKIKKGGHGAHGGAWKIAYADFVTAMMAFFLLMWLLGSTSEGDKKGLQDYFQSPLRVAMMGGGSGSGDSSSVLRGGGQDITRTGGQVKKGDIEAERKTYQLQALKASQATAEKQRLESLRDRVKEVVSNLPALSAFKSQIRLDMTRDGLRIQIVDEQNRPMFDSGLDQVKPYMRDILRAIGSVLAEVPNKLTLEGHTDALPFSGGVGGYSNWELSSNRANASRRELIAGGLKDERVLRVQGLASSVPFDKHDPRNPVNRRISIIVMTREAEERFFESGDAMTVNAIPAEGTASSPLVPAR
ncbi:flagellar motor protein MotB [Sphaerotilus sp.]|jgi:chemotaxis protein MotB|uniref:flagellar motor protein MotB n=1 Tax=Sphaerotilus sp. TaxID=2093942 RepID=UPI0025FEB4C4|nr:flagellar motor protein MotB [Sphaerotilus sp.]